MKTIYTKFSLSKIFTTATNADKKPGTIIAGISSARNQSESLEPETLSNTGKSICHAPSKCGNKDTFHNSTYIIPDDAKRCDASFSFSANRFYNIKPAELSSLKNSFMKQILCCLQVAMAFLTKLANFFFKGLFREGFFNNENNYAELQLVPVTIYNSTILSFNKPAMKCLLPAANSDRNLFMKKFLRKTGIFIMGLVTANLVLFNNAVAQSIAAPTIAPTTVCAGSIVTATFVVTNGNSNNTSFWFTTGTNYTVQLSSSTGSFTTPTTISTFTGLAGPNGRNNSGTITSPAITIPSATAGGTGYKIRIVSTGPTGSGTQTGTFTINALPGVPGSIIGPATICANTSGLGYSITAVTGATNYTWTVPSGWNITNGLGTNSITVTSGSSGGNVTVSASNACGTQGTVNTVNITPTVGTNNTGYTTASAKSDNGITVQSSTPIEYGYLKFPLSSIPSGSSVSSETLILSDNGDAQSSTFANSINALGNNDPTTTNAGPLYAAIGAGTPYNSDLWTITGGKVTLPLNASANTDIQSAISGSSYIAMGLVRSTQSTLVYHFYGYSSGANAPVLSVIYNIPTTSNLTVTAYSQFTSGVIAATGQTICYGGTPSVIGSTTAASGGDGVITYSWRSSADGYTADISGATSATYTPPAGLTATTSYQRYAHDGTCNTTPTVSGGTWTVTVDAQFTSGVIDATGQTICYGGTPSVIGSTTAASGGDGVITYSWRSSADGYTADISGATSATYTPPAGLTATTSYQRYAHDGTCNTTPTVSGGTWTVTVDAQFTSGVIAATGQTICYGGTPSVIGSTTAASGGDGVITYSWRSSADGYTADISGATSATYTPPAGLTATTSYQRYAHDGTCNTTPTVSGGTWTVTVDAQFTSGVIDATGQTICYGGTPSVIGSTTAASGGDGVITYSWRSSADGYTADISGATSATYTPPAGLTATTSYQRYAHDGTCNTTPTVSGGTWTVTVDAQFTSGVIDATGQTICYGGTPSVIGSTTAASGGDGVITYSWRSSADGYTADISGATSATYTPPAGLTATTSYQRYAHDGTCNTTPTVSGGTWTVTVDAQFTSGVIAATGQTICYGGTPSVIGSTTAASGGDGVITYSWRSSADGYTADISGATSATYTPPAGLTATTSYQRYAHDGTCNTTPTVSGGTWTVTVDAQFTSGVIDATGQTICYGGTPSVIGSTTAASGGDGVITYSWRSSADGYTADISGATSATYTPPAGLTATTSYQRYAHDGTCNTTPTVSGGTWTVTVDAQFTSGVIDATGQTICYGGTPSVIGSTTAASGGDGVITYSWRSSADGYTADISGATSATYTPPAGLTATTSYQRYAHDGTCNTTPTVSGGTWTVTVDAQFTSGVIDATGQTICYGGTPSVIGSTTAASGGDGVITYSWRSSADGYTADISGATSATYTPPAGLTATTSYQRYAHDGTCNTTPTVSGGTWTVTVDAQFTSGVIDATGQTICYGGTPSVIGSTTAASGGDGVITYSWRSSADGYTADISGATSATYTPPAGLTATTSYQRYAHDGTCNTTPTVSGGTWTVTVDAQFTSGVIDATGQTICYGGTPSVIGSTTAASGGDGVITYSWRSSADGYTADISGATSATYTPPAGLTATTSYQRYAHDGTCNTTPTVSGGTWTVTVDAQFTSGVIDATGQTICYGGTPSVIGSTTAASGGDGVITYSWRSSADGYTADISGATSATYTPPAGLTATTSYQRYAHDGTCNTTPTVSGGTWTVTVTPTVGTPTAITISAGTEPTCQLANVTTATTYATTATDNIGFNWSLSNPSAGIIGASTGVMTWANGFSGTVDIRVTANGCNGPSSQVVRTVTITPTVGTPTAITVLAGTEPTCQLTNVTTATTYATTATDNIGFNWSLSNPSAGIIGASTGVMTWANGFSGTVDIRVTANGCNGPSSQVVRTVTITPTVGTPTAITVLAGTEPTCQLTNGTTTTTYATTATNNTGFSWSLSNPSAGSINPSTGVVTWANGFSGTVDIRVTANGCNGPSSQVVRTVTVTPTVGTPTAITVSAGAEPTCQLTNGTTTTTYATTATDNTGFNWSLNNNSAGSIDASTGVMTWANGFSGTVGIQVTANGCNGLSAQVVKAVIVNGDATISLTSVVQTTSQSVCMDFPIEDIIYAIGGGGTGAYISGGALPNGVTGSYAAGVFTISGSPTAAVPGTYNYTVTTIGSCGNQSLSGSITVGAPATIVALPAGSQNQVTCASTPISNITFVVGGSATGATAAGLPSGLTGSYNAGIFTISGTPNVSGTFNYTVFTTGSPCTAVSINGTITINLNSTITLTSSGESSAQNICIGTGIAPITYEIDGGSTGGTVTGLPAGVTGVYTSTGPNDGMFTISGTPLVTGTFTYTVTTQGLCANPSLTGTIAIGAASAISLSSPSGSDGQAICVNTAINTISYAIGGGATGASITAGALPAGVTGTYSGGVFTISGTPTASGIFTYTVTATGPCTNPSMNGTITVNPSPIVNGINNVTYCNGASASAISFTSPNSGVTYHWTSTADVGFLLSGNGSIGTFTATNNTNSPITATVSVTATGSGCTGAATTFTVTVNPTPVVTAVSNLNYCAGSAVSAITFSSPTTGGTVTYNWSGTSDVGFGLSGSGSIGAFTAKNNGTSPVTSTITVTPVFNGNCSGSAIQFNVTVTPNAAGTINGPSAVCTGLTIPLTTTGTTGGTWSSSNPAVASVGASTGIVSGITGGSVTITYSVSGSCGTSTSAPFAVTVNAAATAGTVSGPPSGLLCAGSNFTLTTTGTPGGFWFSTTPGIATVDIATGVATGVAPGFALIYYVANPSPTCGGGGLAPITFIVTPSGTNAGVITGATNHICPNGVPGGVQLSTTGSGGSWSSGNTAVATVSASGFVSGVASGTTTIYYTVAANSCGSGSVAQYNITVDQAANAGTISGPGGSNNVCAGSQIQLITNGASGGQWSSGSPAAIVNASTGLVTGQAAGSAIITYTVNNNCGQAQATFTVNVNPVADAGNLSGPSSVCTNAQIQIMSSGTSGGSWSSSDQSVATVDANGVVLGKSPGLATITYTVTATCATKVSSSINITVNPLPVAGTVSDATICNGSSTSFTSVGGTSGGMWSSSNTAVATIDATTGVALAVGTGSTIITYKVTSASGCGTVAATATLTVKPVLNAGTISGGSSVCKGATLNLTASGNSGGSWSSSDITVATVNAGTGVVTGVAPGSATITYTLPNNGCGIATASQVITVNPVPGGITVSGSSTICKGLSTSFTSNATGGSWSSSDVTVATVNGAGVVTGVAAGTVTITYTVTTSCGTASGSANITIQDAGTISSLSGGSSVCVGSTIGLITSGTSGGTWSSSATGIAAVNAASGVVTGMTKGVAMITYTFSGCGNYQATFAVTVNDIPDAGTSDFVLNPDGSTPVLCPGSTASVKNTGGMGAGTWKTSNPAIATVDANGLITGHSAGLAVISYVVSNSCGTSSAGVIVQVNSLPDAGTINGASEVCAFGTINLSTTGNSGGTWTSSNPAVATVDAASGAVSGLLPGTTTIIYTVGDPALCGTSSATHVVTVNPVPYAGTLSNASVCSGLAITMAANGSVGGTWSSSNTSVATVNPGGVVTGVAAGITTISYTVSTPTCGSATATATVTVNPLPVAGPINGPTAVCVTGTITLSSTNNLGTYDAGGTGTAKWSSSSNSIATVGPNTGIVTGQAAGNVTITYTVTTDCGISTSTYQITVNPLPNAGTISGGLFACTGSTTSLTSNVTGGTWASSNTSVATVNAATGVVTGVTAGSSIITYTVTSATGCGTASNTATVTVGDLPNAGTVTGAATLCAGATAIFTSDGTGGGSWSSNNTAAATVDNSGVVTGVAAGSATITYTVSGTCGSSSKSANITINAAPNAGAVSGASTLCVGATAPFTTTGASGGSWSSNNSLVATVNASGVVTAVGPGSASITYTVTNSCGGAGASAMVTVSAVPQSGTVSGASQLCVGAMTTFTRTGGDAGGVWASSDNTIATVDANGVVTGEATGSVTIKYTVTSANCGSSVSSASITINGLPTAGINTPSTTVLTCSTPSITLTATGGGTYSWSGGLGNAANATITAPGVYTVTVTSAGGCTSTKDIAIGQDINAPTAGITNNTGSTDLTCTTQSISVTATGGGTYSWSGGLGNAAAATITAPGTYTVTVTSATNGCTKTASITITQHISVPTVGITNNTGTTVLTCNTTAISVTATGGTNYSWSNGSTVVGTLAGLTVDNTNFISNPTTYTVTVTGTNGCSNTASIIITQNTTPPGTPGVGTITQPGCGVPTGSVVLSGLPATGTWTLTRTDGTTTTTTTGTGSTATISGLPANHTYHFTVTNDVGCVSGSTGDVVINAAPALPNAPTVGTVTQPDCSSATGSVVLNGLPASGSWTITRMPGGTTASGTGTSTTITGLAQNTTYTFTVTNAAGCTSSSSANVVIGTRTTTPSVTASNINVSTDPNSCSALVTLGSNITLTGTATLQYRIGFFPFFPFFSYPITSPHVFSRGTTPVIVIATNSCGTTYAIFNVTVVDNTLPTISCLPNATRTVNGNSSRYSVHGHEFDVNASDGCGIASLVYSLSGATNDGFDGDNRSLNNVKFNVGTTTVTWRATDVNGNVSTCSFTVTVSHIGGSANPPGVQSPSNAKVEMFAAGLTVNVAPNPTSNYFTLSLNSIGTEKIKLNVVDVLGRPVEKITDITPNSTVQIGGKYRPGIYMVQAIQGQQTVVLKLIKEGN